jgi:hypothetical protein
MPSKGLNRLTWLFFFQKFEERKCLILMVKGTVLRLIIKLESYALN